MNVCICVFVYMYVCMYPYVYVCQCICMYVCMHICTCTEQGVIFHETVHKQEACKKHGCTHVGMLNMLD
jgi:hypothetical protein